MNTSPINRILDKLKVKVAVDLSCESLFGYYEKGTDTIVVCDNDPMTILHELAHLIDYRLGSKLDNKSESEVVAEYTALILANILDVPYDVARSRAYIEKHMKVIPDELIVRCQKIADVVLSAQEVL